MSKETADEYGFDGTRYWPYDNSPTRCQCVMSHYERIEGGIQQCSGSRVTNRFCEGCEDTHGAAREERKA